MTCLSLLEEFTQRAVTSETCWGPGPAVHPGPQAPAGQAAPPPANTGVLSALSLLLFLKVPRVWGRGGRLPCGIRLFLEDSMLMSSRPRQMTFPTFRLPLLSSSLPPNYKCPNCK